MDLTSGFVPRRPPALPEGAPIAVVAPASPPRDLNRYQVGLAHLDATYEVRFAWAPGTERGYLSAPDAKRAAALHRAIRSPEIRGIVCVRGGYGCLRLLDRLDWGLARRNPTLLVGYSDVTALHLALYARAGWTGLSGPVVTEWAVANDETLRPSRALARGKLPGLTTTPPSTLTPLVSGTAEGVLLGGNLSVFTRLLGTPYMPDVEGTILVLEEVEEAPYRVDRMLTHLQHAGVLDAAAGVVLGHFTTGDLDPEKPTLSLKSAFDDHLGDRPYPVASGLTYGHLLPRCTLPIGVPVRLTTTEETGTLQPLTPVVAS